LTIKDLKSFLEILYGEFFGEKYGRWVFRGVSSPKHLLVPSIGRIEHTSESFEKFEKSVFDTFKRQAFHYVKYIPGNDYEWLALGQHHGLPTRLLDWSNNPLVALYFACLSRRDEDGIIYCLRADKKLSEEGLANKSPFDADKVQKIIPRNISERMFAQEGLFTVSFDPQLPIDNQLRPNWDLKKINVDGKSKEIIRYGLYRMGVHHAKLFPSLEGLSGHIAWHHQILPADQGDEA